MGVETIAYIALALTAYSVYEQGEQSRAAKQSQERARGEEQKARQEQRAQNVAKAASERRQQVREERVRRARIEQSAVNSGAAYSSGELGATSSLSTQLGTNLGENAAAVDRGGRITEYAQNAATFMGDAQNSAFNAQAWAGYASLSSKIFDASGGVETIFGKKKA